MKFSHILSKQLYYTSFECTVLGAQFWALIVVLDCTMYIVHSHLFAHYSGLSTFPYCAYQSPHSFHDKRITARFVIQPITVHSKHQFFRVFDDEMSHNLFWNIWMKTCDEQPIYEIEIQIYFYIKAIFGVSLLSWRICNWLERKKSPKKHVAMSLNCICLFNCKTFIKFDRFQWNGWVEFQIVFFEFYFLIKLTFRYSQEKKKNILFDFDEFLTILTWNELKAAKPRHMSCDQSTANILWENFANLLLSSSK